MEQLESKSSVQMLHDIIFNGVISPLTIKLVLGIWLLVGLLSLFQKIVWLYQQAIRLYQRDGHATVGHAEDGHAEDGHAEDGHATVGHATVGHAEDGHATVGHATDGHTNDSRRYSGISSKLTTNVVIKELRDMNGTDSELTIYLGIEMNKLREIEAKNPKDPVRQRMDLVDYWLHNNEDVSWNDLADALEEMGGNSPLVQHLRHKDDTSSGYSTGDIMYIQSKVSYLTEAYNHLLDETCRAFKKKIDSSRLNIVELSKWLVDKSRVALDDIESIDIKSLFECLRKEASWYNYFLVKDFIDRFGDLKDKRRLHRFVTKRDDFFSKRLTIHLSELHVAKVSFGTDHFDYTGRIPLLVKLEEDWERLEGDQVERIHERLALILGVKKEALYLHEAKPGCVMLTFAVPSAMRQEIAASISSQKQALSELDVTMIQIGNDPPHRFNPKKMSHGSQTRVARSHSSSDSESSSESARTPRRKWHRKRRRTLSPLKRESKPTVHGQYPRRHIIVMVTSLFLLLAITCVVWEQWTLSEKNTQVHGEVLNGFRDEVANLTHVVNCQERKLEAEGNSPELFIRPENTCDALNHFWNIATVSLEIIGTPQTPRRNGISTPTPVTLDSRTTMSSPTSLNPAVVSDSNLSNTTSCLILDYTLHTDFEVSTTDIDVSSKAIGVYVGGCIGMCLGTLIVVLTWWICKLPKPEMQPTSENQKERTKQQMHTMPQQYQDGVRMNSHHDVQPAVETQYQTVKPVEEQFGPSEVAELDPEGSAIPVQQATATAHEDVQAGAERTPHPERYIPHQDGPIERQFEQFDLHMPPLQFDTAEDVPHEVSVAEPVDQEQFKSGGGDQGSAMPEQKSGAKTVIGRMRGKTTPYNLDNLLDDQSCPNISRSLTMKRSVLLVPHLRVDEAWMSPTVPTYDGHASGTEPLESDDDEQQSFQQGDEDDIQLVTKRCKLLKDDDAALHAAVRSKMFDRIPLHNQIILYDSDSYFADTNVRLNPPGPTLQPEKWPVNVDAQAQSVPNTQAEQLSARKRLETDLHRSVSNRDITTVLRLLSQPSTPTSGTVDSQNGKGSTPVHEAAKRGFVDILDILLQHRPDLTIRDSKGSTALLLAARNGHSDAIRILVEKGGADVNERNTTTGSTALHEAASGGHLECVQVLLQDLKSQSAPKTRSQKRPEVTKGLLCAVKDGLTPLHWSCKRGYFEIAKCRLSHQHCDPQCVDKGGMTPLHYACRGGYLQIVKYLVSDLHCDPQCVDKGGVTPLHYACSKFHAKFLLSKGCDPNCTTKDEVTATILTQETGVSALKSYFADTYLANEKLNPTLWPEKRPVDVDIQSQSVPNTPGEQRRSRLQADYEEALKLGEILAAYACVMLIGADGVGKSSLLSGLMNLPLPLAESTKLAEALMFKYQLAKAGDPDDSYWSKLVEEDELMEMAKHLRIAAESKSVQASVLASLVEADAVKEFSPFTDVPVTTKQQSDDKFQQEATKVVRLKILSKALHKEASSQKEAMIHVWDCGGQLVFQDILPAFLTGRTMFFLMFDAKKGLYSQYEALCHHKGEVVPGSRKTQNITILKLLQGMASIHAMPCKAPSNATIPEYPRIIHIGTHGDDPDVQEKKTEILQTLHTHCEGKAFVHLLIHGTIVDNTTAGQGKEEDKAYKYFRQQMHKFAMENVAVRTPVAWFHFQKAFQEAAKENPLPFEQAVAVVKVCDVSVGTVPSVLNCFHELAVFLYSVESLHGCIIANPRWLVQQFAKLLALEGQESVPRQRFWKLLREKGILVQPLYKEVWKGLQLPPQALVYLLEHFLLAIRINTQSQIHLIQEREYFIPSMLDCKPDSKAHQLVSKKQASPLHLTFSTQYVPPGLFARLVTALIKKPTCHLVFEQRVFSNLWCERNKICHASSSLWHWLDDHILHKGSWKRRCQVAKCNTSSQECQCCSESEDTRTPDAYVELDLVHLTRFDNREEELRHLEEELRHLEEELRHLEEELRHLEEELRHREEKLEENLRLVKQLHPQLPSYSLLLPSVSFYYNHHTTLEPDHASGIQLSSSRSNCLHTALLICTGIPRDIEFTCLEIDGEDFTDSSHHGQQTRPKNHPSLLDDRVTKPFQFVPCSMRFLHFIVAACRRFMLWLDYRYPYKEEELSKKVRHREEEWRHREEERRHREEELRHLLEELKKLHREEELPESYLLLPSSRRVRTYSEFSSVYYTTFEPHHAFGIQLSSSRSENSSHHGQQTRPKNHPSLLDDRVTKPFQFVPYSVQFLTRSPPQLVSFRSGLNSDGAECNLLELNATLPDSDLVLYWNQQQPELLNRAAVCGDQFTTQLNPATEEYQFHYPHGVDMKISQSHPANRITQFRFSSDPSQPIAVSCTSQKFVWVAIVDPSTNTCHGRKGSKSSSKDSSLQ